MPRNTPAGGAAAHDDDVRVFASSIRGPVRPTAVAIGVTTFLVWGVSFFLFHYATETGRQNLAASGFPALFGSWLIVSALVSVGYALGYVVMRSFVPGTKDFTEARVARLSAGDAAAAMAGGYVVGFIPMTLTGDVLTLLAWTAIVGILFSFVAIHPGNVRRFRDAVTAGEIVRDHYGD